MKEGRFGPRATVTAMILVAAILTPLMTASAIEMTYDEAIAIAINRSSRSEIIRGDLDVAERTYFANKIKFYVPEVSLNSTLPSYTVDEDFGPYGIFPQDVLVKNTSLDLRSNIQLRQSLITGGELIARANLWGNFSEYPDRTDLDNIIDQTRRSGYFDFELTQPLLKPSQRKFELRNSRDDKEIAMLTFTEEQAGLKTEVTEAYFGVLQLTLKLEVARDKLRSATLTAEIDSVKFDEEVVSEEQWLESASARIDAELDVFDLENQLAEQQRALAALLDMEVTDEIVPKVPAPPMLADDDRQAYAESWPEASSIKKARFDYDKAKRAADYEASAHGLNGDLSATYALNRGEVEYDESEAKSTIKANSWTVALNLTYPLFDGGASSASVQAKRIAEEKARIEYERAEKAARAEILNLINRVDVGYRKLQVMDKQIELSSNRLDIADFRWKDGQISEVTYLESKVTYLETRDKYLEELKQYLLDRIELEGKFSS